MKLEPLMNYRAELHVPVEVGAGPFGTRRIIDVKGGSFEGPRVKGKILPSGADWLLIGPDEVGRLDVRAALETEDGARIYVQARGVLVLNDRIRTALEKGEATEYGDTYFMTQPRFETGDERYAWINRVVAVAEGRIAPAAVEYRVFHVVND